jgi:hypothetical protein
MDAREPWHAGGVHGWRGASVEHLDSCLTGVARAFFEVVQQNSGSGLRGSKGQRMTGCLGKTWMRRLIWRSLVLPSFGRPLGRIKAPTELGVTLF